MNELIISTRWVGYKRGFSRFKTIVQKTRLDVKCVKKNEIFG